MFALYCISTVGTMLKYVTVNVIALNCLSKQHVIHIISGKTAYYNSNVWAFNKKVLHLFQILLFQWQKKKQLIQPFTHNTKLIILGIINLTKIYLQLQFPPTVV